MPHPMPKPFKRKGAHTWELRIKHNGKIYWRSLKTRDISEARRGLPQAYAKLMEELEPKLAPTDRILHTYMQEITEYISTLARMGGHFGDVATCAKNHVDFIAHRTNAYRARLICREFSVERDYIREHTGKDHPWHDDALPEAMLRAAVQVYIDASAGLFAIPSAPSGRPATASTASVAPTPQRTASKPATPLLSKVLDDFIATRSASMSAGTADNYRGVVRDFIAVAGDKPVGDYTKSDARSFRDVVLKLPANWQKLKPIRRLGIIKASEHASELGLKPRSTFMIKVSRQRLRTLFEYAIASFDDVTVNPFADRAAWVTSTKVTADADQRDAFAADELRQLLAPGALPTELHMLTLLGLFSGCRLGEALQISLADVVLSGDVPHVRFHARMQLKSPACVRAVPIHPAIAPTLTAYVSKTPTGLLFPSYPPNAAGKIADLASKAFRYQLRRLSLKRPGLSFHSLRHTFAATFKRHHPAEFETRERLLGHTIGGVAGRYGASYAQEATDMDLLKRRAALVSALDFGL